VIGIDQWQACAWRVLPIAEEANDQPTLDVLTQRMDAAQPPEEVTLAPP
jgi:hypothetical protein